MANRSHNQLVGPAGSRPERILRNSTAATGDSMPINKVDYPASFTRVRIVDDI